MIYISKFKKNIWPLYVPPLRDELFSSWLIRVANNHKVNPETLINESLDKKLPIKINNIDIEPESIIINLITQNTPLRVNNLRNYF